MTKPSPSKPSRQAAEQRFRASLISSTAVHVGLFLLAAFGPLILPEDIIMPDVVPVRIMHLPPAPPVAPPAVPQAVEEPQPEAAVETVESEPEPIPKNLEQLRRQRDEQRRQHEIEQQRERDAEAERRRLAEEERQRQLEEQRRRRPQKAGRRGTSRPRPQAQQAQRTGVTFTGAETDEQRFTVEEFPFTYYVVTIRDKVSANWKPPVRGAYSMERRVQVYFRIGRNGQLVVRAQIEASSGDALFDQAAARAVAQAAPFPPLPREYAGQSLGVRFAFVQE